jgi:hypothetical protein
MPNLCYNRYLSESLNTLTTKGVIKLSLLTISEERLAKLLIAGKKINLKGDYLITATPEEATDSFSVYKPLVILSGQIGAIDIINPQNISLENYRKIHIIPLKKFLTEDDMIKKTRDYGVFASQDCPNVPIRWITEFNRKSLYTLGQSIKNNNNLDKIIFYPATEPTRWSHIRIGFLLLKMVLIAEKDDAVKILNQLKIAVSF